MKISAGPTLGGLSCTGPGVLCHSGSPPCACPTPPDDVSRPASLAEGNRTFPPFSSPDFLLDGRHTHRRRIPWDWDTFSLRWASPGMPPNPLFSKHTAPNICCCATVEEAAAVAVQLRSATSAGVCTPENVARKKLDGVQVPIHHAQAVQGADGGISLKVEQTKLPEFWGQKDKDSITANAFIQRVDNMMAANNWTDHIAFRNFALVLRGSADVWLKSQETLEDITGDRRAWTIVRPLFKAEFAILSISE